MALRIVIETIPHEQQRYPTVGDWYYDPDATIHIKVSELHNPLMEAVIAIHEVCEMLLCRLHGISQSEVDTFDRNYEASRSDDDTSEPGDSLDAPYRNEHCFATGVERLLIASFGISWKEYDDRINSL